MILHVDDCPIQLRTVARLLRAEGFEVVSQSDPATARHLLNAGIIPSAIICDGMMPGMSGREFFDSLPPELQSIVIFYSGSLEMFHGTPNRAVCKPDQDGLLVALRELLNAQERSVA